MTLNGPSLGIGVALAIVDEALRTGVFEVLDLREALIAAEQELAEEVRCRRANSRDSRRMIEFIGVDQPEVAEARAKIDADPYADGADFGSIVIAYVTRLRAELADAWDEGYGAGRDDEYDGPLLLNDTALSRPA